MSPNIDVIGCVDALCRYYKGILNIRGTALQNELIGIRDNLPTDIRYIRNYLEPIFKPVIESREVTENDFNEALNVNVEVTEWIKGLNDRINNTACLY